MTDTPSTQFNHAQQIAEDVLRKLDFDQSSGADNETLNAIECAYLEDAKGLLRGINSGRIMESQPRVFQSIMKALESMCERNSGTPSENFQAVSRILEEVIHQVAASGISADNSLLAVHQKRSR